MKSTPAALAGPVVALAVLITVLVTAFAWPTANLAPRDLPVGLVGPAPAVAQARAGLRSAGSAAIEPTVYPDRGAAVTAIEDRAIYGAIVLSANGSEVLTASAASPAVAQALGEVAHRLAAAPGSPRTAADTHPPAATPDRPASAAPMITDVVALPAADPRGAVFGLTLVPMVIGGLLTGIALSLVAGSRAARITAALAVAVLAGFAVTAVLHTWLDVLTGNYLAESGVVALAVAAIALTLIGLRSAFGNPGLGVGAATLVALGIPLSGAMSAPELLPSGWGTLGSLLPPGAAATALRSTAYFHGAGSVTAFTVLSCWALAGLLLAALPRPLRLPRPAARDARPA